MPQKKSVCLVTGASSGIGRAVAQHLLAEGHTVAATARRAERLQQLEEADTMPGDLIDPAFQDELERHLFSTYSACDYLFNCAGVIEAGAIEAAVVGNAMAGLRRFKQQGYGHVVNISSILGTKVRPTAGAYAASKFAMEALSEALRMELAGSEVKITCIEPGLVMTRLHRDWEVHPSEVMNIVEPLRPDDIADQIVHVLSQPAHVRIPKLMILPKGHVI